jgi:hypothetical protein
MERFVVGFADRYLRAPMTPGALAGTARCRDGPAFEATRRWRPVMLQHLLLGNNAHINIDLGVTASVRNGMMAGVRR